jgi:hypothetical protein
MEPVIPGIAVFRKERKRISYGKTSPERKKIY